MLRTICWDDLESPNLKTLKHFKTNLSRNVIKPDSPRYFIILNYYHCMANNQFHTYWNKKDFNLQDVL